MSPLADVCSATLPREALAALAPLRDLPGVEVTESGERVWVRWPPAGEEVLRRVLPIPGVELYEQRDGLWFRHGNSLPAFDLKTAGEAHTLGRVLVPAPVEPLLPPVGPLRPVRLQLAADSRPRAVTATLCDVAALAEWADSAPTARLAAVRAARRGRQVLLVGKRLPSFLGAERFWGAGVLVPLGFRVEPDLPEGAIRAALGATPEEVLLVLQTASTDKPEAQAREDDLSCACATLLCDAVEVIPRSVLRPLTRASARLALREAQP